MKRRNFFAWIGRTAAIVSLAPQLAFNRKLTLPRVESLEITIEQLVFDPKDYSGDWFLVHCGGSNTASGTVALRCAHDQS